MLPVALFLVNKDFRCSLLFLLLFLCLRLFLLSLIETVAFIFCAIVVFIKFYCLSRAASF